jgi:WD40 repeat protein
MKYKAFISYSHATSTKLVSAFHSGLHQLAKPWFRVRNIRIFRDKTSLLVTSTLWSDLKVALSESEYLILFASPEAAQSRHVIRELKWWIKNRSPKKLILILLSGTIEWSVEASDFDWAKTSALPKEISSYFQEEPLFVDLRWAITSEQLSLRHAGFRSAILDVASTLHERTKDDLDDADVRIARITKRFVILAFILIGSSSFFAFWQYRLAKMEQYETEKERSRAVAQTASALARSAELYYPRDPSGSLMLAVYANKLHQSNESLSGLRAVLGMQTYFDVPVGVDEHAYTIALSRDGAWLVVGGEDGTIRLWQTSEINKPPLWVTKNIDSINAVSFSADNQIIAAGGDDGTIFIWNRNNLNTNPKKIRIGDEPINSLAISPDSNLIAVGTSSGSVIVWERGTSRSKLIRLRGHTKSITSVTFNAAGSMLASSSEDWTIRFWRLSKGLIKSSGKKITTGFVVNSLAWSPDERILASAGQDGTIRLWNPYIPVSRSQVLYRSSTLCSDVAISGDGTMLAAACWDGLIHLWNLKNLNQPSIILRGSESKIYRLATASDKYSIASIDYTSVRVWKLNDNRAEPVTLFGHEELINSIVFSPDNKFLASAADDSTIRLWNLQISDNTIRESIIRVTDIVSSLAFSQDSKHLFAGSWANLVQEWDMDRLHNKASELTHHSHDVTSIAISSNNEFIASGSVDTTVKVWNQHRGTLNPITLKDHTERVNCVSFSPNGQMLASGDKDGNIFIWDPQHLEKWINKITIPSGVRSVTFSLNNQILAAAGFNGIIYLWHTDSLAAKPLELSGHAGPVKSVAFSPVDSQILASAGEDGVILIWFLDNNKSSNLALRGHIGAVSSINFSSDGSMLASAGDDRIIRIWHIEKSTSDLKKLACKLAARQVNNSQWLVWTGDSTPQNVCSSDERRRF